MLVDKKVPVWVTDRMFPEQWPSEDQDREGSEEPYGSEDVKPAGLASFVPEESSDLSRRVDVTSPLPAGDEEPEKRVSLGENAQIVAAGVKPENVGRDDE